MRLYVQHVDASNEDPWPESLKVLALRSKYSKSKGVISVHMHMN